MTDSKGSSATTKRRPMTVPRILEKKANGEKISVITAYDATFARIFDDAGIDILLVGDSLGMVVQGRDSTLPVSVDEMIYHGAAVARGSRYAHIVIDLPFMSYQPSLELAMKNAGRLLAEGGGHAVKLEGGAEVAEAGAYAIVLEGIPNDLAREISASLSIPTIGIGAGPDCDGQVLVSYDLLGLTPTLRPKFVKRYAELFDEAKRAVEEYIDEVSAGSFPSEEYTFGEVREDASTTTKDEPPKSGGYGPQ